MTSHITTNVTLKITHPVALKYSQTMDYPAEAKLTGDIQKPEMIEI